MKSAFKAVLLIAVGVGLGFLVRLLWPTGQPRELR
jgi:hypothetical protein